jgi:hypothetical protein
VIKSEEEGNESRIWFLRFLVLTATARLKTNPDPKVENVKIQEFYIQQVKV